MRAAGLAVAALLVGAVGVTAAQTPPAGPTPSQAQTVPRPSTVNPSRSMFDEPRWRTVEEQRLAERRAQDRLTARRREDQERVEDAEPERVWRETNHGRAADWRAHEDIARLRDIRQMLRDLDPP